ncbi:hypothetical protein ALC53_07672 [Atta colombica]|uniref:Uncharacterized protein n=1 Tax=Atta colombica TaxID=520822 RepID=A0A195BCF8_9HYME|nr:hypothetical protein ALC53_07672 [Atta colombica]
MVRSSKSLKRTGTMSAHGDNVTIGSSPYYFRHPRESAKAQDDRVTSGQNDNYSRKFFDDPCAHVMQKFRRQITNWSSWNTCRQRDGTCQYTLKLPVESNIIRATHKTSKSFERIEIIFEEINNTCFAKAESVSSNWFTIFDYGENYCNLHNLVVGAGLDRHAKFQELTNDATCTQFNMAVC